MACYAEQTQLGEGIRWDGRRRELLAVDILAGRVAQGRVRDDHSIERVGVYQLPTTVGMIAPIQGENGWVLGAGRGFVHLALTSCALGGPGLHRLFVTTATEGWGDAQRRADPAAGRV